MRMRRSNICLMRNRKKEQKDSQHLDREGFPRIDERQNAQTAEAQSILISEGRREGRREAGSLDPKETHRKQRKLTGRQKRQTASKQWQLESDCSSWSQTPAKELRSTVRGWLSIWNRGHSYTATQETKQNRIFSKPKSMNSTPPKKMPMDAFHYNQQLSPKGGLRCSKEKQATRWMKRGEI